MHRLTIFLALFFAEFQLSAQVPGGYGGHTSINDNTSKLYIGIQCGPAMTSLRGNDFLSQYHHPAITLPADVFAQYNFRKIFSVGVEAGIIRIGSNFRDSITFTDSNGNFISKEELKAFAFYNYYTYSIYAKASLGKRVKYSVGAGMYSSRLELQQSITEATSQTPEIRSDYTDLQKQNDWGVVFGAGIMYPARPMMTPDMGILDHLAYSIDLYDHLGLMNVSAVPVYNDGTIKTNALQIRIGIAYRFFPRYYDIPA